MWPSDIEMLKRRESAKNKRSQSVAIVLMFVMCRLISYSLCSTAAATEVQRYSDSSVISEWGVLSEMYLNAKTTTIIVPLSMDVAELPAVSLEGWHVIITNERKISTPTLYSRLISYTQAIIRCMPTKFSVTGVYMNAMLAQSSIANIYQGIVHMFSREASLVKEVFELESSSAANTQSAIPLAANTKKKICISLHECDKHTAEIVLRSATKEYRGLGANIIQTLCLYLTPDCIMDISPDAMESITVLVVNFVGESPEINLQILALWTQQSKQIKKLHIYSNDSPSIAVKPLALGAVLEIDKLCIANNVFLLIQKAAVGEHTCIRAQKVVLLCRCKEMICIDENIEDLRERAQKCGKYPKIVQARTLTITMPCAYMLLEEKDASLGVISLCTTFAILGISKIKDLHVHIYISCTYFEMLGCPTSPIYKKDPKHPLFTETTDEDPNILDICNIEESVLLKDLSLNTVFVTWKYICAKSNGENVYDAAKSIISIHFAGPIKDAIKEVQLKDLEHMINNELLNQKLSIITNFAVASMWCSKNEEYRKTKIAQFAKSVTEIFRSRKTVPLSARTSGLYSNTNCANCEKKNAYIIQSGIITASAASIFSKELFSLASGNAPRESPAKNIHESSEYTDLNSRFQSIRERNPITRQLRHSLCIVLPCHHILCFRCFFSIDFTAQNVKFMEILCLKCRQKHSLQATRVLLINYRHTAEPQFLYAHSLFRVMKNSSRVDELMGDSVLKGKGCSRALR